MKRCLIGLAALALGWSGLALADDALPNPLSLSDALRLMRTVPLIEQSAADAQAARAGVLSADALGGTRVTASGDLRLVKPPNVSPNRSNNGSSASLVVTKRLYDFGYSDARKSSAQTGLQASRYLLDQARETARLRVMSAFYAVLLADLQYARDNEEMATVYVSYDRLKNRHELGEVSDIALLESESRYQTVRRKQVASVSRRVTARARLALAMGRPGELVSDLVTPPIRLPKSDPEDFDAYWQQVLQHNPELLALRAQRDAARQAVDAARASHGAVVSGEVKAAVYNRNTSSTYPLSAGLVLAVPLGTGGARDAEIARAQADLSSAQAQLADARARLQEQAMDLWMKRPNLRADISAFEVMGNYRDLYLDRSRALYDMEVKTDLGDSMVRISEVRLELARARFDWAMTQARLQALTGQLLEKK